MSNKPKRHQDHKMEYLGAYTKENVASLKKQHANGQGIRQYLTGHSKSHRLLDPSDEPNGIWFFCVERAKKGSGRQFFAIRVKHDTFDVLVPTPLPLDFKRHTDDKGIFLPFRISNKSATHLLDDLITINPEKTTMRKLQQIKAAYPWTRVSEEH